jgi:outer membrane receptor for ferric coprogen and ferric-rhodotorulic acid
MSASHLSKEGTPFKCCLWGAIMLCRSVFAIGAMGLSAEVAAAQDVHAVLDIPAQPLVQALRQFADQTGLQLAYETKLAEGQRSSPVRGTADVREALRQLLLGTQLQFEFLDERTVALSAPKVRAGDASTSLFERASSRFSLAAMIFGALHPFSAPAQSVTSSDETLETVNVFATLESRLSIGSKSGGTLRETPKSVTVVTGERIEAQNLSSLQEVLIQTTGVTVGAFNPLETFYYARGIRLETLQFDGGAPAYTGGLGFFYTPDTATVERVEVLRGVDGMYSGAGEPGGVINLVRKRPQSVPSLRVNLSGGTWDNYRAIVDGTAPLALDGRLRGRAVVSYMDRGYHQDRYTTEKQIVYGTLEFDATDSTLLAVGANYEKRDDGGFPAWGGLPRYTDGRKLELPREYSTAPRWAHWNFETKEAFARVEQRYGETGVVRLNVNQIEQDSDQNYVTIFGAVDPQTLLGSRVYGSKADFSSIQRLADLSASGEFALFGRDHRYTVGTDYASLDGGEIGYGLPGFEYWDGIPINYFTYDPSTVAQPTAVALSYYPKREQSQRGFYATVGIQLADPLRLTLGGRYGKFNYDQASRSIASGAMSYLRYDDEAFIPSAALSYSIGENWTAYLSYGETFKAQANLLKGPPPGGDPLSPITGDNLELGIKGDVFQGVTAAASVYRLSRDGQGAADPEYAGLGSSHESDGSQCCFIQRGNVTVQGADLELSGQIMSGWQVFSGYTFTETEYEGTPSAALTLGRTPKHQLKAWSTYRLPGRLSALTVNAGVTSQSTAYYGAYAYGGLTLWNASVQYALTDKWTLAVYGDNLTDKVYWQPTGALGRQNIYGVPRSFTFSLRGHW